MRKIPIFILSVLLSINTKAQNIVTIYFEEDGIKKNYEIASAKFINSTDTINAEILNGKLMLPESVFKKKRTVIFSIDNFWLKFDSIPITLNSQSPIWTIGIDNKPFDKKKFWQVRSWKKIQIVYYFKNDEGRTFIVEGCKKSVVIK